LFKPDYIVIHTAADPRENGKHDTSAAEITAWHKAQGWKTIGYHYVVRRDGRIEQGRPLTEPGSHARGLNHRSIGICFSGHGDLQPLTFRQLRSGIELVRKLMNQYNIPINRVIGHNEINNLVKNGVLGKQYKVHKTCPGKHINMSWLRQMILTAGSRKTTNEVSTN
jgi:N-acetylmuramoyl-L-alanine amidase